MATFDQYPKQWNRTVFELSKNLLVLTTFNVFNSLGRTPKRKLSMSGNDCPTPTAGAMFQRSLSSISNESGNDTSFKLTVACIRCWSFMHANNMSVFPSFSNFQVISLTLRHQILHLIHLPWRFWSKRHFCFDARKPWPISSYILSN